MTLRKHKEDGKTLYYILENKKIFCPVKLVKKDSETEKINAGLFLIMVVLFAGGYRMFGKVDRFFEEQSENGNKKNPQK